MTDDTKDTALKSSIDTPEKGLEAAKVSNEKPTASLIDTQNTTLKSSIEAPEAGLAAAKVSNEKPIPPVAPIRSAADAPSRKPVSLTPKAPEGQQEATPDKRVIADSKLARAARVGTALGGFAYAGVKIAQAAKKVTVHGDFVGAAGSIAKGVVGAGAGVVKAAGAASGLLEGGKIKEAGPAKPGVVDKALNKISTLPGGEKVADGLGKAYKTVGSVAGKRALKIVGAVATVATNPTPIGVAAAAVSLGSVAYNVAKETLDVRNEKRLDQDKGLLESIKKNKQEQVKLVVENGKNIGKDNPALKNFLDDKLPKIYGDAPAPEKFKGSRGVEVLKAFRDNALEGAALVGAGFVKGGVFGGALAGATAFMNTTKEADTNLTRLEQRKDKQREVNDLKQSAGDYKDRKALVAAEREQKINTKTLEEFLKTPDLDKKSQIQLEAAFATAQKKVESAKEFEIPPEKTRFQKAKENAKELKDCFVESQFGDLKKIYGKDKEQQTPTPSTSPIKKPEPEIAQSLGKEKEKTLEQAPKKTQEQAHDQAHKLADSMRSHNNNVSYKGTGEKHPESTPVSHAQGGHKQSHGR